MKINAVIVAAGMGSRMKAGKNKVYVDLCGKPVLWHTVKAVADSGVFDKIVVVTGYDNIEECSVLLSEFDIDWTVCIGGDTRQESVKNGLFACGDCDFVAIHDGARALVTTDIIKNTVNAAIKYGAAAPGVHPKDTLKLVNGDNIITKTVDRDNVYAIQTPQVFKYDDIVKGHEIAEADGAAVTDDCMIIERMGKIVKITEGSYDNIKLTTPEDMYIANEILKKRSEESV